jgi:hypothetical protein
MQQTSTVQTSWVGDRRKRKDCIQYPPIFNVAQQVRFFRLKRVHPGSSFRLGVDAPCSPMVDVRCVHVPASIL